MNHEISYIALSVPAVSHGGVYGSPSVRPRDLKALAVFLSALADAPEALVVHIGVFRLQVEVREGAAPPSVVGFGG